MASFGACFSWIVVKKKLDILSVICCRNIFSGFVPRRTFGTFGLCSDVPSVAGTVRTFVIVVFVRIEVVVVFEDAVGQNVVRVVGCFLVGLWCDTGREMVD